MTILQEKFNFKDFFKKTKKNEISIVNNDKNLFINKNISDVLFENLLSRKNSFLKKYWRKEQSIYYFSAIATIVIFTPITLLSNIPFYKQILINLTVCGVILFYIWLLFKPSKTNIYKYDFFEFAKKSRIETKSFIEQVLSKEEKELFENKINNMLEKVPFIAKQNYENSQQYLFSVFELEKSYLNLLHLNNQTNNLEDEIILKAKQKLKEDKQKEEKRLIEVKNNLEKMNLKDSTKPLNLFDKLKRYML